MKWKRVSCSNTPMELALDACLMGKAWIFRGTDCIFGWNDTDGKIDFRVELTGDIPLGNKHIVCFPHSAVSFADLGLKNGSEFFSVELETGNVIWKRKYDFTPRQNCIAAVEDNIAVVAETTEGEARLVFIDSRDGNIISNTKTLFCNEMVLSGKKLFLSTGVSLYSADINGSLNEILKGRILSLISSGSSLYFIQKKDTEDCVVCFDVEKSEISSEIKIDGVISLWPFSNRQDQIAAGLKEYGFGLFDFSEKKILWEAGKNEKWFVKKAVFTDRGIVVLVKMPDRNSAIYLLDEENGNVISSPEVDASVKNIFWYKDRLITSSFVKGMEMFMLC